MPDCLKENIFVAAKTNGYRYGGSCLQILETSQKEYIKESRKRTAYTFKLRPAIQCNTLN
uniref:Uncharacterized protein n=1 Tax=Setaria italica TaxID=4555 RepID=K3YXJ7_SETIT